MIIFEPGGGKNLILIILVVLFAGLIAWQWVASDPFSGVDDQNIFLSQIKEGAEEDFDGVIDSFAKGREELSTFDDDLTKQAKQEQLIEEAKKYLEDKVDTSDWLVYKNDKYNFELKYPKDWELAEQNTDESIRFLKDGLVLFIQIYQDEEPYSNWPEPELVSEEDVVFNGLSAVKETSTSNELFAGQITYSFTKSDNFYKIGLDLPTDPEGKNAEEALNTFKFTD